MTTDSPPDRPIVLSGWSAASPFGLGAEAFTEGLTAGHAATAPLDREHWDGPYDTAGLIPDFTVAGVLGRKGTRALDRSTGIALATVGLLLDQYDGELGADPEDIGLVLGIGATSVQSIMDFSRASQAGERPYDVDPALFPNTVQNRATGAGAIRYGLKGPNTTISGGSLTSLLALNYAVRMHRQGHGRVFLCGAVEEYSAQRARLEWHGGGPGGGGAPGPLGEGCAVFLTETAAGARAAGRQPLATVLGSRFLAFHAPGAVGATLARAVTEVLAAAGATAADVRVIAPGEAPGPLGAQEEAGLDRALGTAGTAGSAPVRLRVRRLLGDTGAASAGFQLAAVLSLARAQPQPDGALALVTSVSPAGTVGCTLLRLEHPAAA
ncbi:beta-ketoacyl synthase N-terminal-like domain-containing protein [Kitasatospora sp. NPDC085464]|uniref:beta-ketoacyl synthase N-terminal-like domain-containing protein n=1 Tax=Kitasatospora sp. NPDC085464 TaxID=3364063 RepID=UPI0037CB1B67